MTLDDARERDRTDPLADYRRRFVPAGSEVIYFDGNSLGRPPLTAAVQAARFVSEEWGERLIRGWDEGWMERAYELGDQLGRAALGAAPGQTVLADSTTVLLYKLARAAVDAQRRHDSRRREIVADRANFPTDRYLVEGIAAERDCDVVWIETAPGAGVSAQQLAAAVGDRTALVLLSHVDYRSAYVADAAALTGIAHDAGALVLWDLCHSVGILPVELDVWGVDLAVGCTYKYLNAGPGAPAFCYVRSGLAEELTQPIQGWMGAADVFAMRPRYEPGHGIRRFVSGTPPILGMVALPGTLSIIGGVGIEAVRAKSIQLTEYAIAVTDELLTPLGAELGSPRDSARRGGHVTIVHPAMRVVAEQVRRRNVLPDYRDPDGLRIGLSPLSTSFVEVWHGLQRIETALASAVAPIRPPLPPAPRSAS